MSQQNKKQRVALSSVFASAGLTIGKLVIGLLTGSMGIISEAAHSALDFGAALLTYFAVRVGDKPADERHHFGHEKVESVSAFVETGLLFLTSIWIIYEAVRRLLSKSVEIEVTWYAFLIIIISIIVDISRSRALKRVAKETNSQALEADALHFSSDILSSAVVLFGLVFVAFGVSTADVIAAICVALFVMYAGYRLGKRTIDVLVDTAPEGVTERIMDITRKVEGVLAVEKLRVRPVGVSIFVDMSVAVSRQLPLERVNMIAASIERNIRLAIPETDITIHTKPQTVDSETIAERIRIVAANLNLSVHDIVVQTDNGTTHVSFDVEVETHLTIAQAHEAVSRLEEAIHIEVGNEVVIDTHIEPTQSEILCGERISSDEEINMTKIIDATAAKVSTIQSVHKINIRRIQGNVFISLHCTCDDSIPLTDVHRAASRLEYLIRERIPTVEKVVVHAEPKH